ncbi:MAG: hypothetical protein M3P39_06670, partial [Actinomycetota bacterium]|nr:hypothetical protein [Actinomycetota bacterium]
MRRGGAATDADGGLDLRGAAPALSLALVLAACALLFDAEPLWVPAVVLVLLALAALAWVLLAARGLRVVRRVEVRRVVEDEPLRVHLDVRARVALPGGALHDPLLAAPAPVRPGRRHARVRVQARFARRGRRRLGPPRVVVTDPLGLVAHTVVAATAGDDELLVLPRTHPVVGPQGGGRQGRSLRRGRPTP